MRFILIVCFLASMGFPATSSAELRIIGVRVTKDSRSQTRVSIYSDVAKENKVNVAVEEAATILRDAKGWGSSVKVGIVADNVMLGEYLPLLTAISQNLMLELAYVEGQKPTFIHDNIRNRIKEGEAAESKPDISDAERGK